MFVSTVLIGESFDVRLREGASGERMCVLCNPQIKREKNSIDSSAEDIHLMSFTGNSVQCHRQLSKNGLGFSTIQ